MITYRKVTHFVGILRDWYLKTNNNDVLENPASISKIAAGTGNTAITRDYADANYIGGGAATLKKVNFNIIGHGFTMLGTNTNIPIPATIDPTSGLPIKADSSDIANECFGFISVVDIDNIEYIQANQFFEAINHGLTIGELYYLTDISTLSINISSSTNIQKILEVIDGNTLNLTTSQMVVPSVSNDFREVDTNVSTAKVIDWDNGNTKEYTMVGDTTFSDINLPSGIVTSTLTMYLTGAFIPTFPTYWDIVGAYDNTVRNQIVLESLNGGVGVEDVIVFINQLN